MPLPGGPTDKIGNRYEEAWTVYAMLEVMEERASAIRLEPPGEDGVEFWLRRRDALEYYQVKRQRSAGASWSLADLRREKVLSHFWSKLEDESVRCVFASEYPAHELKHLAERAASAASFDEFQQEFLKARDIAKNFRTLRECWSDCTPERAYEALKRISVKSKEETDLRESVEALLKNLIDDHPATVYAVLAQLAKDSIHETLTAHSIWHHLEGPEHRFRRRHWANDPHALARVKEVNDNYLLSQRAATIGGRIIPRDATQRIVEQLTEHDNARDILIVGEAGSGKSCAFQQAVEKLLEKGTPVLALRLDLLDPVLLPRDIGRQLDLPGSPVQVLADIAQGQQCVLAIDQLDAVILSSDRTPKFLHCIDALLEEARAHPHMRLLVACRQFYLEHDEQIQQLLSTYGLEQRVMIDRLTEKQIRQAVADMGWNAERLSEKQIELLSCPLHLSLFAKVPRSSAAVFDFKTANDLYQRFWTYKDRLLRRRLHGQPINWVSVMDALCNYMSDHQILFAPESVAYGSEFVAEAMVSEQILIKTGKRYAPFHESFFDYAFARQFVSKQHELVPFLLKGEQSLFRRDQVRQILLQERTEDLSMNDPRYLSDLKALLTDGGIRSHIKQIVFALLAELDDPIEGEWQAVAVHLDDPVYPHQRDIWNLLYRSISWFRLLDSLGVIGRWLMAEDEERLEQLVMLLSSMQQYLPDRVAELVEPFVGIDRWRKHFASLILRSDVGTSRRFLDLFLRLIDDGTLDKIVGEDSMFWSIVSPLPKKHADWACEAVGHYFRRRLTLTIAAGQENPFEFNSGKTRHIPRGTGFFMQCAAGAPITFVVQILPFMLVTMERMAVRKGAPPWRDPVWGWRHYGEAYSMSGELLHAMVQALGQFAADQPEKFVPFARLLGEQEFETAHFLLIRTYTANGARFADEAANYLCASPRHLRIGYTEDVHWAARQLIEAITPHCSSARLAELEECLLAYYPELKRGATGHRNYGYAQFSLLEGIEPTRRSVKARRRLEELKRKFGVQAPRAPVPFEDRHGWVESPIPLDAVEKMTDEQWMRAMAYYRYAHMDTQPDKPFVGGAHQLSRLLEPQARKEPVRYARLLCNLPLTVHPYYIDAILRGISDAGLDGQLVLQVCQYCHNLPGRPCGVWLCNFIGRQARGPLPADVLEMVAWYAAVDTEEEREQAVWHVNENGERVITPEDIVSTGLGMVRGSAARTIGELVRIDGSRIFHLLPALESLVGDPSIAVRACSAEALHMIMPQYRELAVALFQRLCEADDALLATGPVASFLFNAVQTHFTSLETLLKRMLNSGRPETNTIGAQACCLAALITDAATNLAQSCIAGTDDQRVGAAKAYAVNLRFSSCRRACREALLQLFNDPIERVRSQAATCFRYFEGEELQGYSDLVEEFIQSPAFATAPYELLHALERTASKHSELTCTVCEKFLDIFASEMEDRYGMRALQAGIARKLILAVYSHSQRERNKDLLARSLNVIDRLARIGILDLNQAGLRVDR